MYVIFVVLKYLSIESKSTSKCKMKNKQINIYIYIYICMYVKISVLTQEIIFFRLTR